MLAEVAGPDQRAAKKMRPGHCKKKKPSRVSWVDLPRDTHWHVYFLLEFEFRGKSCVE